MSDDNKPEPPPIIIRNTTDLQRLKLEKLMKNPDKPVLIPEKPKERGIPVVPDFVRNVMGSSAGAGSGEFHVYRHLRRKEYARQKFMKEKGEREKLDNDYHDKLETNKINAAQRTAKKRQKRLKRKQNLKGKKKKIIDQLPQNSGSDESSSCDSDEEKSKFQNEIEEKSTKGTDEAQKPETKEINSQIEQAQNDSAVTNTEIQGSNQLIAVNIEHTQEKGNTCSS